MALLTVPEAKAYLRISSSTDDAKIEAMVEAVTVVVEDHLRQSVEQGTRTETHYGIQGSLWLNWPPVQSVTSITVADGSLTWAAADLILDVENGRVVAKSGKPRLCGDLTVVYEAGMDDPPANVIEAAKIIVGHMWETQNPSRTVDPRFGGQPDAAAAGKMGFLIPRRAAQLLGASPPLVG